MDMGNSRTVYSIQTYPTRSELLDNETMGDKFKHTSRWWTILKCAERIESWSFNSQGFKEKLSKDILLFFQKFIKKVLELLFKSKISFLNKTFIVVLEPEEGLACQEIKDIMKKEWTWARVKASNSSITVKSRSRVSRICGHHTSQIQIFIVTKMENFLIWVLVAKSSHWM